MDDFSHPPSDGDWVSLATRDAQEQPLRRPADWLHQHNQACYYLLAHSLSSVMASRNSLYRKHSNNSADPF
ncbi:hypothetical protein TNIN_315451 [Trichonephila inaurata madagascariensis]|nr:hypothetical protein TNIN_294321 [Trichonephila inaurata madagascariensis]GFY41344.1 hypothetical protein TNIN_315451 [Trichonephila inaurata madagascariensis]